MKLFRMVNTYNYRIRFEDYNHGNYNSLEGLGGYQWVYKVDTWKLPEFERLFIGAQDRITQPTFWNTLNQWVLFFGTEFQIYINNLYLMFWYTRTFVPTWRWQDYFEFIFFSEHHTDMDTRKWDDLLEYDEDRQDDDLIYFLQELHTYSYNNETSSVILFDTLIFDIFNTLYLKRVVTGKLSLIDIMYNIDYQYIPKIRHGFSVYTLTNLMWYVNKYWRYMVLCSVQIHRRRRKHPKKVFSISNPEFKFNKLTGFYKLNFIKLTSKLTNTFHSLVKPVNVTTGKLTTMCSTLLRKNRVYTKSKYSRARQYCRNIVLLGLLLNVILMFGLNSGFYAILINAGFFISIFYILITVYSVFVVFKYRLYDLKYLFNFFNVK